MIREKASAVLLRWKRPKELEEIIEHLKGFPEIIDEIIVWDNREQNLIGYGRILGMLEAKNDVIYTQDDDVLVHNIPELYNLYNLYEGRYIVNGMSKNHLKVYKSFVHSMLGWGSFINKSFISNLNRYIEVYGIDDIILRDTSRIFTGLAPGFKSIIADIIPFESASSKEVALYNQPEHIANRKLADYRIRFLKQQKQKCEIIKVGNSDEN